MSDGSPPPERQIFANRTLNLRSIRAIGYDMDYTLIHYRVEEWERRAFEHTRQRLADMGWPVDGLTFDPRSVIRGLTIDLHLGNLIKPTRFGYVIRAAHGSRHLEFDELRQAYAMTFVDLAEERFVFLNTLFSLSEASLFSQLVELLDRGELPGVKSYENLYETIRGSLDDAHMEGKLKAEIVADPERFVVSEPETVAALFDQHQAGKRLLLITNSEWEYTRRMMAYAFDPHLPEGTSWRDLFDMVVVSAAKPDFFQASMPLYRVEDEDRSLLLPHTGALEPGSVYFGGCAPRLEEQLGLDGGQILYVGDHLYSDVSVSKAVLRWRTALILRELETEVADLASFAPQEQELQRLMLLKEETEGTLARARLLQQRQDRRKADGPPIDELRTRLAALDEQIGPLARAAGEIGNPEWGPLMRSGSDKSLFARQVERYADVYTSRVANFGAVTPFGFLRASRGSLPHEESQP